MTIARRGLWIAVVVVLVVEAELHGENPVSMALVLGLTGIAWAGRWPLQCVLGVSLLLLGDTLAGGVMMSGLVTPLLVVAGVSFLAGGRAAPVRLALATAASVAVLTVTNQVADPGTFTTTNDTVFFAVLVRAPALAGHLLGVRSRQVAQLCRLNDELDRLQSVAVRAARANEVERVERAVDGALAGRLVSVIQGIRNSSTLTMADPGAVPALLAAVETTSREGLCELRAVLGVLRSPTQRTEQQYPSPGHLPRHRDGVETSHTRAPADLLDIGLFLVIIPLAVETSMQTSSGPGWLNVMACAAQGVLLMAIRRAPIPGALAWCAVACAQTALLASLPQTVGWIMPALVVAFLLGLHVSQRHRWWGLAVCLGAAIAGQLCTAPAGRSLDGLPLMLLALGLTWWAGITAATRQGRATQLRIRAGELSRTADVNVSLAAAEQRSEMARDLHDVGAHALTVVCLQAVATQALWDRDREQAFTALAILTELAEGPLQHLSVSLRGLTTGTTTAPLDVTALGVLVDIGSVLGLRVDVDVRGHPRPLPCDVAKVAFRVVQESLTNAARHAPGATVRVALAYEPHDLRLLIQDSGPAATTLDATVSIPGSGIGLRGMRERVEACRGELECGPDQRGGFHVLARLPMAVAP